MMAAAFLSDGAPYSRSPVLAKSCSAPSRLYVQILHLSALVVAWPSK